jgi:hypothetical protein
LSGNDRLAFWSGGDHFGGRVPVGGDFLFDSRDGFD